MPAGNLGPCRLGRTTVGRCPAELHNDVTRQHKCARRIEALTRSRTSAFSSESNSSKHISLLGLLTLLLCVFTQYASALALVGRPRSWWSIQTRTPTVLLIDESATSLANFKHESIYADQDMDLSKRQTQSTIASDSSTSSTASLPQPFDGGLGNNFTASSCPLYFQTFLSDPDFQSCHAVSLLLVVS